MITQKKIAIAMQSLSAASTLTVRGRNLKWEFTGLNSPYISHQKAVVSRDGHHFKDLIVWSNANGAWLAVTPHEGHFEGDYLASLWEKKDLPVNLEIPVLPLHWPEDWPEVVEVAVKDNFSHFDGDGEAVSKDRPLAITWRGFNLLREE